MIDRTKFANLLGGLAATLPLYGREYSKQLQDVYWHALADVSDEDFEAACGRCLREMKQFPTPSEILERAPDREHGALELRAARIFLQIVRTPRHNAGTGSYWREDEIRRQYGQAAADAFVMAGATAGFRAASDPDRERFIRRDFLAGYVQSAKANPAAIAPAEPKEIQPAAAQLFEQVKRQLALPAPRRASAEDAARKQAAFRSSVTRSAL